MPDPALENKELEDALLKEIHLILQDARHAESFTWTRFLEERARPRLRLAFLDVQLREASNGDEHKISRSPRVIELQAARKRLAFDIAKLDAEKQKR